MPNLPQTRRRQVDLAALDTVEPLDPSEISRMTREAEEALLGEGESDNTRRTYRTAVRYWAAWFALRYRTPIALPVPETAVRQFIVDHAQRTGPGGKRVHELPEILDKLLVDGGYKAKLGAPSLNTLVLRVSALSALHKSHEVPNPCDQTKVRELLARTRRAYARRGDLPRKKAALTREPLEALLATCDDSLAGLRDRALLLFAFSSGGRRRSEVAMATVENTIRVDDGYVFRLSVEKTNQAGRDRPENEKPIAGRAADALCAWLEASAISTGALFRRVRRGDVVGEPLSPAAVRRIVKARCLLAGLEGDFSAHSLRSGFVTEAAQQQIPIGEAMAMTGHRSLSSFVGYFRQSSLKARGGRLLD